MKKRSMVLLLALVMALGLCVTTAWAEDSVNYFDPTVSGSDQNKTCPADYTSVTGSTGTWEGGTSDAPKWYVVNSDVTISGTVNVTGHVCLILCDGKTLTAEKGIEVKGNSSTLTVYGQSGQTGKLVAKGACVDGTSNNNSYSYSYSYSYGIFSEGALTFNGGKIETTGAALSEKKDYNCSYGILAGGVITINAGTVTATGGEASAESHGICAAVDLVINGGTVNATGGKVEGSDFECSCGISSYNSITINNGTVTAIGGEANGAYGFSYGIWTCNDHDLTIRNGTVTATGGKATSGAAGRAESCGICAGQYEKEDDRYKGSLIIEDGTVSGTGGEAVGNDAHSYGICSWEYLTIDSGTVTAKSTDDNGEAIVFKGAVYLPESYYYRTAADAAQYRTQNMYRPAALGGQYFELTTTKPKNVADDAAIEPVKYMDHNGTGLVEGQCTNYTTIVSKNGNVTLAGGTNDSPEWFVVKDDVTINGTLTFKDHARLILCDGAKLTVKGGSVSVPIGVPFQCGIFVYGVSGEKITDNSSLTIYGQSGQTGELVAKSPKGDNDSYGIYTYGALTVNGGVIKARGGAGVDVSYGIYSTDDMTINAGRVTAEGRAANYSYGLFAQNNLIVNGGVIEATGGEANATGVELDVISAGIYVRNDALIVNNGSVTARSGKATATGVEGIAESYGIYADDDLTIKNGTVIAETTADSGTTYNKAAVFYGKAYSMPDAYGTAWWWRTVKDGAYQAHPSFRVADLESDYFELITTDPYPHQHTRRQPTTTTDAPTDSDKGTEDKTGVVTSANTFDAGVAVYAGLGVLSLTGSAWVARKKW